MELRLSYSKVSSFRRCSYYYKLHYLNKVRKVERPTYFAFGTAVHEGIRAWYQGLPIITEDEEGKKTHLVDRVYAAEIDMARLDAQRLNKVQVEIAKVKGLLAGYIAHYESDLKIFEQINTERDATIPIDVDPALLEGTPFNRVTYYGLLDCLVKMPDGWWIKETKTTGDDIDNFLEQAKWNAQLCGNMALAKSLLGVWPRGVLFDVIVKTQISQRTSKKPETLGQFQRRCFNLYAKEGAEKRLFVRSRIPFNARDLRIWQREIVYAAEDMLDCHRLKRFPMNYEGCKGKYGLCEKFPVCSTGAVDKRRFSIG